jgi:hypothetical protein
MYTTPAIVADVLVALAHGLPIPGQRKLITPRECQQERFQGQVCLRAVYALFERGGTEGFRVGRKILLYADSVESYVSRHGNGKAPVEGRPAERTSAEPVPARATRRKPRQTSFKFFRLPEGR